MVPSLISPALVRAETAAPAFLTPATPATPTASTALRTSSGSPPALPRGRHVAHRPLAALLVTIALTGLLSTPIAQAGQRCEESPPRMASLARGLSLAHGVSQALDRTGADVVLLARAGQDLQRHGLQWSHVGFAYRLPAAPAPGPAPHMNANTNPGMNPGAHPGAYPGADPGADPSAYPKADIARRHTWRVVHKLNECGQATGGLYRQGLAQFFNDEPYRYEAALLPLKPEVSSRLLPVLRDDGKVGRMHEPHYSLVAYPWSQRYQQSNQWAIETLAYAMERSATTRSRAQAWLMLRDYQPTVLNLHALERLGGRMSRANVSFDDHPGDKRWNDRIETVGADSVLQWLARNDLALPLVVIR